MRDSPTPQDIDRAVDFRLSERKKHGKPLTDPEGYERSLRRAWANDHEDLWEVLDRADKAKRSRKQPRSEVGRFLPYSAPGVEGPYFIGFDSAGRGLQDSDGASRVSVIDLHNPFEPLTAEKAIRAEDQDQAGYPERRRLQLSERNYAPVLDVLERTRPEVMARLGELGASGFGLPQRLEDQAVDALISGDVRKGRGSLVERLGAERFLKLQPITEEIRSRVAIGIVREEEAAREEMR